MGDAIVELLDKDDDSTFRNVVLDADVGNSTFTELSLKK